VGSGYRVGNAELWEDVEFVDGLALRLRASKAGGVEMSVWMQCGVLMRGVGYWQHIIIS
jgi:hypothetical protein